MLDPILLDRYKKLKDTIEKFAISYYENDEPEVPDAVYDSLVSEYKQIEKKYPDLFDPNFIIHRVGGRPLDAFGKVSHRSRMLSLNDAFSYQELDAWQNRLTKILDTKKFHYFCELKLDGLAVSLIYEDGLFVRGATRGDGEVGEDVTQNLKTISSIPMKLKNTYPGLLEIRGEVVMSKRTLIMLNKKYQKQGKATLANSRNAAAGSLRQLDSKITKERNLDFFAWDVMVENEKLKLHSDKHDFLRKLGFIVAPYESVCKNLDEVVFQIERILKIRDDYDYSTDGLVIQVNEVPLHTDLGVVGKAPRYAIAYKYPAEQATTKVLNIDVNVGRTGVLTPLAHFVPTLVAGSTVSKATLHNMDQIDRLDIRIGDTVVIQKAGDVIPEVVEVIKSLRTGKEKKFHMPKKCPVCAGDVIQRKSANKEETVAFYCDNDDCPAKQTRGLIHFVRVLDIFEVGPKIIERLQDEGLISDAADLFALTEADLSGLERMGEKSAKNIITSIQSKKNPPLEKFIASLGINNVGEETARDLSRTFKTFDKFWNAEEGEFEKIPNIGPTVAESIIAYRNKESSNRLMEKFASFDFKPQEAKVVQGGVFAGQTFVLTGTLPTLSRDEAKKIILENSGKVTGSVSKNTSYVLAGENPGSKYEDAKKLGVKIIEEEDFLKMTGSLV